MKKIAGQQNTIAMFLLTDKSLLFALKCEQLT